MSDETKTIDKKKLSTEQRLELLEKQVEELSTMVRKLWGNALWEREQEMNRRRFD